MNCLEYFYYITVGKIENFLKSKLEQEVQLRILGKKLSNKKLACIYT